MVDVVRSPAERREADALVHQRYVEAGYCAADSKARCPHPAGSRTLVVRCDECVVATVTAIADGRALLPADALFPEALGALRAEGARLMEASAFAAAKGGPVGFRPGLLSLLCLRLFHLAVDDGVSHVMAMVNPRHVRFWARRYGFSSWAGPRHLGSVNGAPAVLMGVQLR
jgi:hypothetical protein